MINLKLATFNQSISHQAKQSLVEKTEIVEDELIVCNCDRLLVVFDRLVAGKRFTVSP